MNADTPGAAKPQPNKTAKTAAFAFCEESVLLGSPISRLARSRFRASGRLCEIPGIARFHPLGSASTIFSHKNEQKAQGFPVCDFCASCGLQHMVSASLRDDSFHPRSIGFLCIYRGSETSCTGRTHRSAPTDRLWLHCTRLIWGFFISIWSVCIPHKKRTGEKRLAAALLPGCFRTRIPIPPVSLTFRPC